jgi:helix-turn-helix protein
LDVGKDRAPLPIQANVFAPFSQEDKEHVASLSRIFTKPKEDKRVERFLDEGEVANFFNVAPAVVLEWRRAGTGPAFIVMPEGIIRYRQWDLHRWFESRQAERMSRVYGIVAIESLPNGTTVRAAILATERILREAKVN